MALERRVNAIKLSQGEHAGSPLKLHNTRGFGQTCVSALNLMALTLRLLSPCRSGRLSLRITRRWNGQFTSLKSAVKLGELEGKS
ncbi:MAG: hypothetical protein KAI83_00395 [Thiomargarita sp.]|nr:hypothetical protein [Thiomargarita sp.]